MQTRNEVRRALAALAMIFTLSACAGEEPQGIRVPLSGTGSSGSVYALRGARFRIVGPRTITLNGDETAGDTIAAGLPVGDYTVTLLDGWTLVRLPDGTPMIATLASANPVRVTVSAGMRVRVTFVFDVMGEMVAMTGDGDIDIGFEVRDDAGTCGVAEVCNGADDDCDGAIDEGLSGMMFFADTDGDGFGDPSMPRTVCAPMPGFVPDASDCDDRNPMVNPMAAEGCNMIDDDCDGVIDEGCGGCMPAAEVCNGADDDCDMLVDEGLLSTFFRDGDADGFGQAMSTEACSQPPGFAPVSGDCDDADAMRHPGAPESCNGRDDDCDGSIDQTFACALGTAGPCTTSCGTAGSRMCDGMCSWTACAPPLESCNGIDDDCDGTADDGFSCAVGTIGSCTTVCGTTGTRTCNAMCTFSACMPPAEICNGADDDCDGSVDEGC